MRKIGLPIPVNLESDFQDILILGRVKLPFRDKNKDPIQLHI